MFIFSDKYCEFPNSGNLALDWCRWYKRAIKKSADQVWGAERWLRDYPNRVFVDEACSVRLPIALPSFADCIVHRIVVAHGSGQRCREVLGGSGSLMIHPLLVGTAHYDHKQPDFAPFAVGLIDAERPFVHVVDDFSLDAVLKTLDTAHDFATYLQRREEFIASGRLLGAAGEEELLAFYVSRTNDAEEHAFVIPPDVSSVVLDEGFWQAHIKHPDRLAQVKANDVSYAWDLLIDKFTYHAIARAQHRSSHPVLADQERALRYLAREGRTRRRMLAKALLGIMKRGDTNDIAARVVNPSSPGDPHFVFLSVKISAGDSYSDYLAYRRKLLESYCMVTRLRLPNAHDIVGIATEPKGVSGKRSEDLIVLDGALWDGEARSDAQEIATKLGLLTNIKRFETVEPEYPRIRDREMKKGRNRNQPCICGSGDKYKLCCGR